MFFDAALQGMAMLFHPQPLMYLLIGTLIGLFLGAIPGMTGMVLLAILIPFTIGKDPISALALLLGAHTTVEFSGSISSILMNTPANGQTVATCFDGYPMTQKGEAARAIANAATASAVGGIFGFIVLVVSLPVMKTLLMALGAPEYFILTFVGITFIAVLGDSGIVKAFAMGGLGLMLSLVGEDPMTATARFSLGTMYLWDGVPLIPVVVGIFAISSMADSFARGKSISEVPELEAKPGQIMQGIKDVFVPFNHFLTTLKCSALGSIGCVIPGIGGTAINLMAYGLAKRTSKNKDKFGTGWPEGVIAPEAATNSKEGAHLVPTVALGIPGSASMALLLGVFVMLGLQPGPEMLGKNLHITLGMAFILPVGCVIHTALGLLLAKYLAKFSFAPLAYVVPCVLVVALTGAYLEGNEFGNIVAAFVFGLIGMLLARMKLPRAPLIIGLVLGRIVERYLHLSIRLYGTTFFTRPLSLIFILVAVLAIFYPVLKKMFTKKGEGAAA